MIYMGNRLDIELVKRGFVNSRTKAQELIKSRYVLCNNKIVDKNSIYVSDADEIKILENDSLKYVSKGGVKLEKAIREFDLCFVNKNIMDIGSSTGGFTDCAIQNGAKEVIAIDVGTDVMDKNLRKNKKVKLYENTNIKDLSNIFFKNLDYILIDVSFLSLIRVFEKIADSNIDIDVISLIKPQFECGKDIARKYQGVILNKNIHKKVIKNLVARINSLGFFVKDITFSPIKGGDGNIEYLAYFTNKIDQNGDICISKTVDDAFKSL